MKKILCFALCISLMFLCSCFYIADYPDTYTTGYCYNNYVKANPNLRWISRSKIARNSVKRSDRSDTYDDPAGFYSYWAIKKVPVDEYLVEEQFLIFETYHTLVKNKNYSKDPIFDYNAKSAKIVWRGDEKSKSVKKIDVDLIKDLICESIKSEQYIDKMSETSTNIQKKSPVIKSIFTKDPRSDTLYLGIEITFSEYKNIFWRGLIVKDNNKYYVKCFIESERVIDSDSKEDIEYNAVFIELPEDISKIIAKVDPN